MALMNGTTDDDTVTGTSGNDTLNGLAGNDLLLGLGGDDVFNAGEGNDTLRPGPGNATLDGGDGTDTADLSGIALNVSLIITFGSGSALSDLFAFDAQLSSIENLVFGAGNDQVIGDNNPNRIEGGDGADVLFGVGGADTILGGNGNDVLNGGPGNDSIDGGPGDDAINPGSGSDTIIGGPGANGLFLNAAAGDVVVSLLAHTLIDEFGNADSLIDPESFVSVTCGPGNDSIGGNAAANRLDGSFGNDTVVGLDGADTLIGGNGNDSLDGGNDNDSLNGGAGNNTLDGGLGDDFLVGGFGSNTINDAGGNDTVSYEAENGPLTFAGNRTVTHAGGVDTVAASIEQIDGTFFNDSLIGSDLNDRFLGFSGNDNLNAFGGNDFLNGGRGNDSINGGDGNDTLIGGPGDDFLTPETGNNLVDATLGQDAVFYGFSASPITVNPNNTVVHDNGSIDTIMGSAAILGTPFGDAFNGGSGNDSFDGSSGIDVMAGGGGDDTLSGGPGSDILDAGAGASALLIGGQGNDALNGGTTLAAVASYASSFAGIVADATTNIVQDGLGGNDTLIGINAILGSSHNDTLSAGAALDRQVVFQGGGGDDSFVGGGFGLAPAGLARVSYDQEMAGIIVNLDGGNVFRDLNDDVLTNIHDIVATRFADQIIDSSGSIDRIDAGAGDDSIEANGGNDTILAGAGNDTVSLPLVNGNFVVDFGSGNDDLSITQLIGIAPPPQAAGENASTAWAAIDATTLMATSSFDGDTLGSATFTKGSGTLTIELDAFDQSFAIAAYAGDLILHPQGDLAGSLGMGDDSVTAAAGTYNLDGGGGINTIDYSVAGGIAVAFSGNQANVTAGVFTQNLQHFLRFVGSPGADTITGDAFNNATAISAAQLLALVDGLIGSDPPTVRGGGGGDSFSGRVVADYALLGGPVTIGAAGPAGSFAANTGAGNDTLASVFGVILPDQDNAVSLGARSAVVEVTGGSNTIIAGDGAVLSYRQMTAPLVVDLSAGTASHGDGNDTIGGIDNVIGGAGDDSIQGNQEDNLIAPGGGSNQVFGGDGDDTAVFATPLSAIAEAVYLRDSDRLLFATIDDSPAAAQSLTEVESGDFGGETVAIASFARALPVFDAATALDDARPVVVAPLRNDDITGTDSADTIVDLGGANRAAGGNGNDLIVTVGRVSAAPAALPPDLTPSAPGDGDDELVGGDGNDTLLGGAGADLMDGGDGEDRLLGQGGADSLAGGGEDDLLLGGAGNDLLFGEEGNDTLIGEAGQDLLVGGPGDDRIYAESSDLAVIGDEGLDVLAIQGGTAGLSVIDLEASDNQNRSGSGPAVSGIEGVDASAADGPVSLHATQYLGTGSVLIGSAFADSITGADGNDTLIGGNGGDLIVGGLGNDSIILDAGNDTASGGDGADAFAYPDRGPGDGIAEVMDFLPGTDRVVLPRSIAFFASDALAMLTMTGDGAFLPVDAGSGILFVGVAVSSFTVGDFLTVVSL